MILRQIGNSLLDLFYPKLCLHCTLPLEKKFPIFCEQCLSLLEMIDPNERCLRCFSPSHPSVHCRESSSSAIFQMGAAFEYAGPPSSLVKAFKYRDQPYLAEAIAPYLVAQLVQLKWPFPDCLVPVPLTFTGRFSRGYNQSTLLAQSVAKLIERPLQEVLMRTGSDFPQAKLKDEERRKLPSHHFKLKKEVEIADKVILLIDDVMTTGTTLKNCALALQEGNPSLIYALTACKAMS